MNEAFVVDINLVEENHALGVDLQCYIYIDLQK